MILVILPVSLYKLDKTRIKFYSQFKSIYVFEEPIYFGYRETKMDFNRLKLYLHRCSMKQYYFELKKSLPKNKIRYVDLVDSLDFYKVIRGQRITLHDPVDKLVLAKFDRMFDVRLLQPEQFLLSDRDIAEYPESDRYSHHTFFKYVKSIVSREILLNYSSQDTENRKSLPKDYKSAIKKAFKVNRDDQRYVMELNGIGTVGDTVEFPTNTVEAEAMLDLFLKKKLAKFGPYQDAIHSDDTIYHSMLSSSLNIGLLTPYYVCSQLVKFISATKVPLNSIEGFYRQLVGWREYQRFLYCRLGNTMKTNYFGNQRKMTSAWYSGMGIKPVDDAIKMAFSTGYLHHIQRLMIMANFMNLCGIHPSEAYRWFMEFSIDSYDWVMIGNVYSMGMFADGGLTMRKPYISSGDYIRKMSNYTGRVEEGDWLAIWRTLFYRFLILHRNKLYNTPYRRNYSIIEGMSEGEKKSIVLRGDEFIRRISR
jgi:deoxyribodipyrimidine photolyase-related protein